MTTDSPSAVSAGGSQPSASGAQEPSGGEGAPGSSALPRRTAASDNGNGLHPSTDESEHAEANDPAGPATDDPTAPAEKPATRTRATARSRAIRDRSTAEDVLATADDSASADGGVAAGDQKDDQPPAGARATTNRATKDSGPEDAGPEDSGPEVAAASDAASKDGAPQKVKSAGATTKQGASKDAASKDTDAKDAGPKDGATKHPGPQGAGSDDAKPKAAGAEDAGPKEVVTTDAGTDAGTTDAGAKEARTTHVRTKDVRTKEARTKDAEPTDAALKDAALKDAEPDATATDATATDATATDATATDATATDAPATDAALTDATANSAVAEGDATAKDAAASTDASASERAEGAALADRADRADRTERAERADTTDGSAVVLDDRPADAGAPSPQIDPESHDLSREGAVVSSAVLLVEDVAAQEVVEAVVNDPWVRTADEKAADDIDLSAGEGDVSADDIVAAEVVHQLEAVVDEDSDAEPAEFAATAVLDVLRASGWADVAEATELRAESARLRELLAEVIRDHRAREASMAGTENQQLHWLVPLLRAAHGVAFGSLGAKVALRTAVQDVPPEVLSSAGLRIDYGVTHDYANDYAGAQDYGTDHGTHDYEDDR